MSVNGPVRMLGVFVAVGVMGATLSACRRQEAPSSAAPKAVAHPASASEPAQAGHSPDLSRAAKAAPAQSLPASSSGSPASSSPGVPARPVTSASELPREPAARLEVVKDLDSSGSTVIPVLGEVLARDSNAIIRGEAARGLGRLLLVEQLPAESRKAAISILTTQLTTEPDPTVVVEVAQSLASGGQPGPVDALLQTLAANRIRPDGYGIPIRIAAIQALGACGDRRATPALVEELGLAEDMSFDNEVVVAMDTIGDPAALAALRSHRDELLRNKPSEPIARQPWQEAVFLAEQAIRKMESKQ